MCHSTSAACTDSFSVESRKVFSHLVYGGGGRRAGGALSLVGSAMGSIMPTSTAENYPQLLSLAVHELRTPASVVGGYLRMLQRDTEPAMSERQRRMIDEAEKSCQRLR